METPHTHWKNCTSSEYLGAYSLNGKDLNIKFISVGQEKVIGDKGKQEMCLVARLENEKPIIINKTNARTITKILGTPYLDEWVGKSVTVFATTTSVGGEVVECLRVRSVLPVIVKSDNSAAIKSLKACTTIEQLATTYQSLPKAQQSELVALKDELKVKLSPKATAE